MEATCKKCGQKKDARELYEIIIISQGHIHTYGEKDCLECQGEQKKDESFDTSIF